MRSIKRSILLAIPFISILSLSQNVQSDEVSRAALLSYTCAGCHGTSGVSPGSIPSIVCKSSAAIETALKGFRDGKRFSTVMGRHVKGYTDEEIHLIAGYFTTYCPDKAGKR